jgi:hypothetical protein
MHSRKVLVKKEFGDVTLWKGKKLVVRRGQELARPLIIVMFNFITRSFTRRVCGGGGMGVCACGRDIVCGLHFHDKIEC